MGLNVFCSVKFNLVRLSILVLIKKVFQCLIEDSVEVVLADEKSPFKNI